MGTWVLFLLMASQLIAQGPVDATFGIGLQWLRGDNSLFSVIVNTSNATTETAPRPTLQDVANATTEDSLHVQHTELVRNIPAVQGTAKIPEQNSVTATMGAVDLRAASTAASWTDAANWTTVGTTEVPLSIAPWLVNATPISLDQLALEIANVPDPVLQVVDNGDGSQSFLVVSGPLGSTTTAADTTTVFTEATTTAAPSTTAVPGTTRRARPSTTSRYQILLDYLRPFLYGRFGSGDTTSPATTVAFSTAATTPSPDTTTPFYVGSNSSPPVPTATTVAGNAHDKDASLTEAAVTTASTTTSDATTEDVSTTTLIPAEWKGVGMRRRISFINGFAEMRDFNDTVVLPALPSTTLLPNSTRLPATPSEPTTTYAPTSSTPLQAGTTEVDFRTPVIVKAVTTPRPTDDDGDRYPTTTPFAQTITETPTASFPAIFDLYGANVDPGSPTPTSYGFPFSSQYPTQHYGDGGDSEPSSAAQEPVYRHFYDPSQLVQTF